MTRIIDARRTELLNDAAILAPSIADTLAELPTRDIERLVDELYDRHMDRLLGLDH